MNVKSIKAIWWREEGKNEQQQQKQKAEHPRGMRV